MWLTAHLLAAVALCVWHASHDDALSTRSCYDRVSKVRVGVEVVLRPDAHAARHDARNAVG
jgi:hypothetical protein